MTSFKKAVFLLIFFLFPLLGGCNTPPPLLPTTTPIESISYKNSVDNERCCLLVLLPGRKSRAGDFEAEGFIKAVRDANLAVDLVAVDAHLGYFMKRSIVTRLKEDIIEPAKAKGYKQIWLVGVSMGGMGVSFYAKNHPEDVTGILLIAPYLGEEEVIQELTESGGLENWTPPIIDKDDYERDLWQWFKETLSTEEGRRRLYLAYGRNDRFSSTHKLLADALPEQQLFPGNGRHTWSTWRPLWKDFLDSAIFPKK